MFSSEFCELFKNTYFAEHLRTTSSVRGLSLIKLQVWQPEGLFPANIPSKTSSTRLQRNNFLSFKTSSRRLEDISQDVLKTSWKRFGMQKIVTLKTSWRNVFKACRHVLKACPEDISWRNVFKTSSRRLGDKQNVYWRYQYLTILNVYLTNLYFINLYLTNLRRMQNALIRTQ